MSHYVSKKRDARTTQRQYELMLDFMIKHPDIASGRHANTKRANYEKHWEELASVLNSDTAGPSKATTKWMKCWSDWKHNTRTKSAKIRQFKETPADGRFPCLLTSLEERLLKLMASFKNDTTDSFNCKQEPYDAYGDFEMPDIGTWFSSQMQYPCKKEDPDVEPEEEMSEVSSDDGTPFNTADFCIPIMAPDDDILPNVEIKSGNGLSSAISIETWKKRKRLYSDESSHSHDSQVNNYAENYRPPAKHQETGTNYNNDNNNLVKETLNRIAEAVERSAKANERCAMACERLANLCERVTSACERSSHLNEIMVNTNDQNLKIQAKQLMVTEQLQRTAERQAESSDKLVGIVQSVAEQSIDAIKKYTGANSPNSIRR